MQKFVQTGWPNGEAMGPLIPWRPHTSSAHSDGAATAALDYMAGWCTARYS